MSSATAHAKPRTAAARASTIITLDRLTPIDLDLDHGARGVWREVLAGVDVHRLFGRTRVYHRVAKLVKSAERYCPLATLAELIVWCANRRIPESRVRVVLTWLEGVVSSVYVGNAHADLDQLDLEEQEAENHENTLSTLRRIKQGAGQRLTREELEAEAMANFHEAAICITRGRELRRQGRLLSTTRVAVTTGELA